jgi:uncharacterized protein (DUF1800 family)
LSSVVAALLLAACGGGSDGDAASSTQQIDPNTGQPVVGGTNPNAEKPVNRAAAARFLTQATFGPTEGEIDTLMGQGYGAWIDAQLAKPASNHRATWEAADAVVKAADPKASVWQDGAINAFWKHAITGDDQLRQRVAFAWSQVFVISMQNDEVGDSSRAVSAYIDMLGDKGLGNYRELLEAVALHPMMGAYLSHLRNQKADPRTGRVPDENFAREVMQLFSIGVHELNADGTVRLANGQPVETYTDADISGLAKVFTGFSWACPEWPNNNCFAWGDVNGVSDPDRTFKAMMGYPQYHSTEEKKFLGKTIPAQSQPDPNASLKQALDTLAAHPNVGPFIGKQLIQRLVSSNPSPAYVGAVAAVFNNNGQGVRGDLKAVVKAVLMHPEARVSSTSSGKVREPVLRMAAYARAFNAKSDTGNYRVGNTDNPGTALGQTPMRSPSVFNFYRPGYVAPGSQSAAAKLVAPELQILHETSAAGYVNYAKQTVEWGLGSWNGAPTNRPDIQADLAPLLALADKPGDMLDIINGRLMAGGMPPALKTEIETAVNTIALTKLNAGGTNQSDVDRSKRVRVNAALLLTMVSPEFQVQR